METVHEIYEELRKKDLIDEIDFAVGLDDYSTKELVEELKNRAWKVELQEEFLEGTRVTISGRL